MSPPGRRNTMSNEPEKSLKAEEKQEQFMQLYKPCHQQLSRYCRGMTVHAEEARDLMSETVLIAYENLHRLKKTEAFAYFLLGIAKRIFLNGLRRRSSRGTTTPSMPPTWKTRPTTRTGRRMPTCFINCWLPCQWHKKKRWYCSKSTASNCRKWPICRTVAFRRSKAVWPGAVKNWPACYKKK